MAEKLKDMFFSESFVRGLARAIGAVDEKFEKERFVRLVFDKDWEERELKARMRHVTECLSATLPDDYPRALEILKQVAPQFRGFDAMVFPDFVENNGMDHWDLSMTALGEFTTNCSSEFAVRPFLAKDAHKALKYFSLWARHPDPSVRRLASEGCRPRLPWAMALPVFKKDPRPILPVLERLKNDESESVRRSVANNLNDISKDNPDLALDVCERWSGQSSEIDWIVKHACRDLLKSGNKRALMLFGFGDPANIHVENFSFDQKELSIGEDLRFSFELSVKTGKNCRIRLEYAVYYVKASGRPSRKIFQIREIDSKPGRYKFSRKQTFMDFSTRRHYPGEHFISIFVNGVEKTKKSFLLKGS